MLRSVIVFFVVVMVYMQLVFIRKKLGQNIEKKAKERYGKTDALEQKNNKKNTARPHEKFRHFREKRKINLIIDK